jgi:hypothetical protein
LFEQSSIIESYCKPPPPNLEMIVSKLACFYKTNKYFHTMKSDKAIKSSMCIGIHILHSLRSVSLSLFRTRNRTCTRFLQIYKLCSTTELMPAIVLSSSLQKQQRQQKKTWRKKWSWKTSSNWELHLFSETCGKYCIISPAIYFPLFFC